MLCVPRCLKQNAVDTNFVNVVIARNTAQKVLSRLFDSITEMWLYLIQKKKFSSSRAPGCSHFKLSFTFVKTPIDLLLIL